MDEKLAARLEARLDLLQEHCDGLAMAVSWLLAKHPGDDADLFLSNQANEFEDHLCYPEIVVALDSLRAEVAVWRDLWSSDQNKKS